MPVQVIYIIIFTLSDLVIWLLLNKPNLFNRKLQYLLAVIFALFIVLHTGFVRSPLLLPWKLFFNLIVVTCAPVLLFAWYTGLAERRKSRSGDNSALSSGMLTAANLLFGYLINISALVIQIMMITGIFNARL